MNRPVRRLLAAVAMTLIVAAVGVGSAHAASGTLKVTSNTTLTSDFVGQVVIAKDGVTLDCAGHDIVGSGSGRGITVEKRRDVTVRNCDVSNFATGFWIASTSGSTFESNQSHDNVLPGGSAGWTLGAGMWLQSSSGNTVIGNSFFRNAVDGIDAFNSSNNRFEGNSVVDNGAAGWFFGNNSHDNAVHGNSGSLNGASGFIVADGASDNRLTSNHAQGNAGCGYTIDGNMHPVVANVLEGNTSWSNECGFLVANAATGTHLTGNQAMFNVNGFVVADGATGNRLEGNTATDNADLGIVIVAADGNSVTHNTADNNLIGIAAANGAANNTFDTNSAAGNTLADAAQDGNTTTTGNVWTNNTFGTTINIP